MAYNGLPPMFANTQMMGTDSTFPDACLDPTPAPARAPAAAAWPDICLAPSSSGSGPTPAPYPNQAMGPVGVPSATSILMAMPGFAPAAHPSVAGGAVTPSVPEPSPQLPNLPNLFSPSMLLTALPSLLGGNQKRP